MGFLKAAHTSSGVKIYWNDTEVATLKPVGGVVQQGSLATAYQTVADRTLALSLRKLFESLKNTSEVETVLDTDETKAQAQKELEIARERFRKAMEADNETARVRCRACVDIAGEQALNGVLAAIFQAAEMASWPFKTGNIAVGEVERAQAEVKEAAARSWLARHADLVRDAVEFSDSETRARVITALIGGRDA